MQRSNLNQTVNIPGVLNEPERESAVQIHDCSMRTVFSLNNKSTTQLPRVQSPQEDETSLAENVCDSASFHDEQMSEKGLTVDHFPSQSVSSRQQRLGPAVAVSQPSAGFLLIS